MFSIKRITSEVRTLWRDSAPLTAAALLMIAAFFASVAGIFLDARIITGVPAWLKPAKFAISSAIFFATVAWLYRYIKVWPRFMKAMAWIIATLLVLEVAIIDLQAARGVTSHFNVATPFDGVLFSVMGASIVLIWLASIGVLVGLFRQTFANPAWGWWLRAGMLITVVGSATGGLMIRPTPDQLETIRESHSVQIIGSHTVGGPDGGPGIAGVGWSTEHGDLRVAHFLGLHGLQIVPFLGWLLMRRSGVDRTRRSLVFVTAGSYLALIAILVWQAWRGQSVMNPDATTMLTVALWAGVTIVGGLAARRATVLRPSDAGLRSAL